MGYSIRKTTYKGDPVWQVICPDGRVANEHNFPDYDSALKKLKTLEALFGDPKANPIIHPPQR